MLLIADMNILEIFLYLCFYAPVEVLEHLFLAPSLEIWIILFYILPEVAITYISR